MSDELWLLRHGQTEWSLAHRHTGRTDLPLTEAGEQEARAVAGHLPEFAAVLCSPLQRARRTAELAGVLGQASFRDELMEWDYGQLEGRTTEQERERVGPDWTIWTHGAEGGEPVEDVGARADRIVAEARAVEGERVLLVAHGHLLRVLAARWLEQPAIFGRHLKLETARVCTLGYERETPVLLAWNVLPGS